MFDALRSKILSVKKQFTPEKTIQIANITFTLGVLSASEETFINFYATSQSTKNSEFLYYLKNAAVALAIKKVDELNLGEVAPGEKVETGELDDSGKPIFRTRFEIMVQIVNSLSAEVVNQMYLVHAELVRQISEKIKQAMTVQEIPEVPEIKETDKIALNPVLTHDDMVQDEVE